MQNKVLIMFGVVTSLAISGCQSVSVIDSVKTVSREAKKIVGFKGTEYKVPSYYSTTAVEDTYQIGRVYYIDDLKQVK